MKRTLKKLLKRNIAGNLKQFLFVIAIVFLSVTLLSGFLVNSKTLTASVDNYFADTNLADLWVYTDKILPADEQFLNDNNIKFDKRLSLSVVAGIKDKNLTKNSNIFVYDKGSVSTPFVYSSIAGCWIDKNVAKNNNLKVGQDRLVFEFEYPLETAGQKLNLNLKFDLLITGTMCLSEQADTYSSWPILIDKTVFLAELNKAINAEILGVMPNITPINIESVPYNQLLIKSENIEFDRAKIEAYYQNQIASKLLFIHGRDLAGSVELLQAEVLQSEKMIYIFPVIFLLVSLLVIVSTISQLILQERQKIGILKSLGATNKMLINHYSSYGAVLCLIGSGLGLIVGPLLIPEIMFIKYDLVYSLPSEYVKLVLPIEWLVLMLALIALMGYVTALLVCREIVSKKPAWCLKLENKRAKKPKTHKKSKLWLPLKMAFRNLKIKPFKSTMAVVGVAGCVALLLCGFGIGDTLNCSIDNDLKHLFSYDISAKYKSDDFLLKLDDMCTSGELDDYEVYKTGQVEVLINDTKITENLFLVDENSKFMSEKLLSGQLMLSRSVAEKLGKKAGDKLLLQTAAAKREYEISKVIETAFFNAIYVCDENFEIGQYQTKAVWISAGGDTEKLVEKLNVLSNTNSAQTIKQVRASADEKVASISLITTTLKTFAILLAVVVLLNLIFLILKERVREIATLKVVGQGLTMVASSICLEILIIAVLGTVIGMIFGFPLLVWVLSVNKVKVMNFLYHISFASFALSALIIFVTIAVISLICLLKVKKIDMIAALKSVE